MEYKNIINIKIKDFQLTENNTYKCLNKQFVDTEHCLKGIRLEDFTPELEKRAFEEIENNK